MQKGIMVSSDNLFKDYNTIENIDFVFVRAGYTDFNKSKTKKLDTKFYENYNLALDKKLNIGVYYESCATNLKEAGDEIDYLLDIIKDKKINYPVIIQIEDDHNTIIYHPKSQKNTNKDHLLEIALYQIKKINEYGYNPVIKTYETWYKNIFKGKITNIKFFLDNNIEYFDDIYYMKKNIVINNTRKNIVKIEIIVRKNDLLHKIKKYIKAGYKIIKRKIGGRK